MEVGRYREKKTKRDGGRAGERGGEGERVEEGRRNVWRGRGEDGKGEGEGVMEE